MNNELFPEYWTRIVENYTRFMIFGKEWIMGISENVDLQLAGQLTLRRRQEIKKFQHQGFVCNKLDKV